MRNIKFAIIVLFILCPLVYSYHFFKNHMGASYTIEELQDKRRVDGIVEPVFTQDCFPRTLAQNGVTKDCFERANLGENSHCSESELKMIKEYYKKGQENDPLNDGTGQFCAEDFGQ